MESEAKKIFKQKLEHVLTSARGTEIAIKEAIRYRNHEYAYSVANEEHEQNSLTKSLEAVSAELGTLIKALSAKLE